MVHQHILVRQIPLVGAGQFQSVQEVPPDFQHVADFPPSFKEAAEERFAAVRQRRAEVGRRQHEQAFHRAIVDVFVVVLPDPVTDHQSAGRVHDDVDVFQFVAVGIDDAVFDHLVVEPIDHVVEGDVVLARFVVRIQDGLHRADLVVDQKLLQFFERSGAIAPAVNDQGDVFGHDAVLSGMVEAARRVSLECGNYTSGWDRRKD
ncbi:hypothetical protein [Nitrospina watsonii]|uniref:hypothetical protein n=1 Tax=Nitrospina watsonii TaxID=1323948 RepID=UPI002491E7E2|nr:hypothetical protein [Nitrospina watsonii]